MSEGALLNDVDRQRFAEAVEASFAVSTRSQLFVWTQSSFHALVPHEILICGIEDGSRQGMAVHRFSASRYFRQSQFDVVADPLTGLTPKLLALTERSRESVVFCPAEPGKTTAPDLLALVEDNELKNIAAQLVAGTRGTVEAFYVFARLATPPGDRLAYLIELLVPHLHTVFLRVLAIERQLPSANTQRTGRLVTPRQEQILNLVKGGKTNSEIAQLLNCSPWTIKNHIQAILRKLDSNTRTHAISRAISLGILRAD